MSAYDRYDAPYERERGHDDRPRYETYTRERESERLKPYPVGSRDLVRHRDSDISVEEVRRDFPPPGYRDVRRARSAEPGRGYERGYERDYRSRQVKGSGSVYYQEEEARRKRMLSKQEKILAAFAGAALALGGKEAYDRYEANHEGHDVERNYVSSAALGAAGAFAGYQGADFYNKHSGKEEKKTRAVYQGRDGRYEYYSDDEADGPAKKSHKKFLESVLGVTSMGAAVKMLTGGGGDDKSSRRGRSRSSSQSSRSRGQSRSKLQKAAMASLIAGATEAFRISKEPGGWKGEKAKRVVTAAVGAGALGGAHSEGHSKKDILESVLGGLMGNRVLHGSKSNIEADDRDPGRSRSRSRARSSSRGGGGGGGATGLAALATAGLTALTAKKALDGRDRSRSRRRDSSSDGSRSPSRRRGARSRSRSVVDGARRSLAKLGIGSAPGERDDSDHEDSRHGSSRRRRHSDDGYGYDDDNYHGSSRRDKSRDRGYDDDRSYRPRGRGSKSDAGSDTDLGDSDDDEKRAKKMKGKQILTSALAGVATIHAAHEVYQSMEKRKLRQKAVSEGRLSPEEAKKLKTKAIIQDLASVGVAGLGIKGAISELKEVRHIKHECKEFQKEKRLRHERRLERMKRANSQPRRRSGNWSTTSSPRPDRYDYDHGYDGDYDNGYYTDGNPYAATLSAPPVGHDRR